MILFDFLAVDWARVHAAINEKRLLQSYERKLPLKALCDAFRLWLRALYWDIVKTMMLLRFLV
jgi:hypothetical protein